MGLFGSVEYGDVRDLGPARCKAELPTCATNNIHFFHVARTTSEYPQEDCPAQWKACDSNELKSFSAAGYFFAKSLNAQLNVPIGMIESAWGGTPAEVWTPAELVNNDSVLKKWAAGQRPCNGWPYIPGYCYNGDDRPAYQFSALRVRYGIRAKGTRVSAPAYGQLFTTMIGCLAQGLEQGSAFLLCADRSFTYGKANIMAALLREQQAASMSLPGTGMVVISDLVSDTTNIHPKDKHDVGYRLANWALTQTYHKNAIAYKSPMYKDMSVKGEKLTVNIDVAPGGLVLKGSAVHELIIAGEDKVFYPAEAKIDGSKLIVWSKQVKTPVAVRYQFDNAGIGNIFGKDGLPLAPFRTDNW